MALNDGALFDSGAGASERQLTWMRIASAPSSWISSSAGPGEPLSSSEGASTVVNCVLFAFATADGTSTARPVMATSKIRWRT